MAITIKTRFRLPGATTKTSVRTDLSVNTTAENLLGAAQALLANYHPTNANTPAVGHSWLEIDGQKIDFVSISRLFADPASQSPEDTPIRRADAIIETAAMRSTLADAPSDPNSPRDRWVMGTGTTPERRRYIIHTQEPTFIARIVQLDPATGLPLPAEEPLDAEGPLSFSTRQYLFCEIRLTSGSLPDPAAFKALISDAANHIDAASQLIDQASETETETLKAQLLNAGQFAQIALSVQFALAKHMVLATLNDDTIQLTPQSKLSGELGFTDADYDQLRDSLAVLDIFLPNNLDKALTLQNLANMMFPLLENTTPGTRQ